MNLQLGVANVHEPSARRSQCPWIIHKLFICEISVKLKSNDDGQEAKSIGDCGEDRSSRTHSIFDRTRHDLMHERADVTVRDNKKWSKQTYGCLQPLKYTFSYNPLPFRTYSALEADFVWKWRGKMKKWKKCLEEMKNLLYICGRIAEFLRQT